MGRSKIQNPKSKINPKSQCQMSSQKSWYLSFGFGHYFVIWILSFVILTSGCAKFKESIIGFAGVSTKILEEKRIEATKKTFNYDYFTSFTKSLDLVKSFGCYIYKQDVKKQMIALYVSETDTTPVGIFFQEIDASNTQVEVSSASTYAKELISAKLFQALSAK
jgi:hypothetical protein